MSLIQKLNIYCRWLMGEGYQQLFLRIDSKFHSLTHEVNFLQNIFHPGISEELVRQDFPKSKDRISAYKFLLRQKIRRFLTTGLS